MGLHTMSHQHHSSLPHLRTLSHQHHLPSAYHVPPMPTTSPPLHLHIMSHQHPPPPPPSAYHVPPTPTTSSFSKFKQFNWGNALPHPPNIPPSIFLCIPPRILASHTKNIAKINDGQDGGSGRLMSALQGASQLRTNITTPTPSP